MNSWRHPIIGAMAWVIAAGVITSCGAPAATSGPAWSQPDTTVTVTQGIPLETPTSLDSTQAVELGGVVFHLPAGSLPSERPEPVQLPPEVIQTSLWVLPNETSLRLTLQSVEPKVGFSPIMVVQEGGLRWEVYDVGFENGSELVATATVEGGWLLISLQQSSFEPNDSSLAQIEAVLQGATEG